KKEVEIMLLLKRNWLYINTKMVLNILIKLWQKFFLLNCLNILKNNIFMLSSVYLGF
ncbi:hypothetical protein NEILACOT_05729, partial [Neisseria lactamica ATCC 23970]